MWCVWLGVEVGGGYVCIRGGYTREEGGRLPSHRAIGVWSMISWLQYRLLQLGSEVGQSRSDKMRGGIQLLRQLG